MLEQGGSLIITIPLILWHFNRCGPQYLRRLKL